MNKQDVIKKAYGEYWNKMFKYTQKEIIENDGYLHLFSSTTERNIKIFYDIKKNIECVYDFDNDTLIPVSIENIWNNNGWIKIESEADYPKPGQYWVIDDDGDMFITDMELFENEFDWSVIEYYQPITKPLKPIY